MGTMDQSSKRRSVQCLLAAASLAFGGILAESLLGAQGTRGRGVDPGAESDFVRKYCKTNTQTAVPSGSEAEARQYYRELGREIGLTIQDPPAGAAGPITTLENVIGYLGYTSRPPAAPFTAKELQDAGPGDLMDPGVFGDRLGGVSLSLGDVLVARFFAPKISDVSESPVKEAGWRKLVRLRALPGSAALSRQIEYGIVLFNFFAPIGEPDPFRGSDSVNTQVALVSRRSGRPLYWVDFGKTSDGAKLSHQLNAFFDAGRIPASATVENGGAAPYFVPCACISCHGGLRFDFAGESPVPGNRFSRPVLDYLDTDHWQERTAADDDFAGLKAPVLFDPGTFSVIMLLNLEIERQNAAAQPDSALRRAAQHWITSHLQGGQTTEALFDRALASSGSPTWNKSDPVDAELLPKLNRYCFRCHGSVLFDVMDKQMVRALVSNVHATLFPREEIVDKRLAMPPDRTLDPDELKRLRDLALALK
jgi:hypothetical protein